MQELARNARQHVSGVVSGTWRMCFESSVDYERVFAEMKRVDRENRLVLKQKRPLPLKESKLAAAKRTLFQVFSLSYCSL